MRGRQNAYTRVIRSYIVYNVYSGILAEVLKDVVYSIRSGTVVRRGYQSRERARDGRGASRLSSREPFRIRGIKDLLVDEKTL